MNAAAEIESVTFDNFKPILPIENWLTYNFNLNYSQL